MVKPASQRANNSNNLHPHHIRRKAVVLAVAACFSSSVALANPTAPTVVHGTASFNQAGSILNVTNSHNAIINWGSFSIGLNELTRFIQPSALSAVLNRVVGQDPSAILGALQSNGRVFLINPNGIVFGAGAQINVAGLVASTLNISNDDFLNNRMRFVDGAGAGGVVNQGSLTGGSVYLVGNAVTNNGLITSPNGEVVLAAGNSVELVNPGTPNLRVEVVASDNEARNLGTITADAGRIGIYAGLIKQGGVINADSAVAEGGRIMLKSAKSTVLEAGSVTSARGTSGGEIIALSGMTDGVTQVAGTLDASAIASGAPGKGGFIETSAAKVQVADSALITAAGRNGGQAGTWLIDPNDFYIAAYGSPIVDITGASLSSILNGAYGGTNIDILSAYGGSSGTGSIFVNDTVTWGTDSNLRLIAEGNINVNSAITNNSTGDARLYAGWNLGFDGNSAPTVGSAGNINLYAPINTGGNIHLVAGGNITQDAAGSLTAAGLLAYSNNGSVNLTSAANAVDTIAGRAIGQFAFNNTGDLTVGTVGGTSGITAYGVNPGLHVTIDVTAAGGVLTVADNIYASAADGSEGQAGGNAAITLTSTGPGNSVVINSSATVEAWGGAGGYGYFDDAGTGGNAVVTVNSAGSIAVNGAIRADGGEGGYANNTGGVGGRGGDAAINLTAGGTLTIDSITSQAVRAVGGAGGYADWEGTGGRGGDANITLQSGGLMSVGNSGYSYYDALYARGGTGGYAYEGGEGAATGGRGGDSLIQLTSAGGITVQGSINALGGYRGSAGSSYSYGGAGIVGNGGNAKVVLTNNSTTAPVQQIAGTIHADGGEGLVGGNAQVIMTSAGGINTLGYINATGGAGNSGYYGDGYGSGGNASIQLTSTSGTGIQIDGGEVYARGGDGGYYGDGTGGNAEVKLTSAGGITVNSYVQARGGNGGYNGGYSYSGGMPGNGGHATVTFTNTGTTQPIEISISGYVSADGGEGATGGNAAVTMTSAGGITVSGGTVRAGGGYGLANGSSGGSELSFGAMMTTAPAQGGTGSVVLENSNAGAQIAITEGGNVNATGGGTYRYNSSEPANGGDAVLILSSAGGITVGNGANAYAQGGDGDSGQGGAAGATFLAGGNILIEGGEGAAWGGGGAVGGNAALTVMAGGSIVVDNSSSGAYDNLVAYSWGGSGAATSIAVSAGGNLDMIGGASAYTSGFAALGGANITIDDSSVWGQTGVSAGATGSLNVVNSSSLASYGNAYITTVGDVLVENGAYIAGNPDVIMKVGGAVRMNTDGQIRAGAPTTILLTFPMLESGGYFVNGIEGVVFDGNTGFFADGSGAILGQNLLVTYGGAPVLNIPTNTLIVAMGESVTPPDPEKDKNVFEDEKDAKKKKETQSCR